MFGIEGVTTAVEALLRDRLPGKMTELRTRYGVVDGSLPDITRFITHELDSAVANDKPPLVVIAERSSDTLRGPSRVTDDGRGGSVYSFRYGLVLVVYARGREFRSTTTARQRYGLAVRECLLQTPGIGPGDPGTIVLRPESIRESYSEVARQPRTRDVIAATAIELLYDTQEHLPALRPAVAGQGNIPTTIGVSP